MQAGIVCIGKVTRCMKVEYGNEREFAAMLSLVAGEMAEYANAIGAAHLEGKDIHSVEWKWSTYALEAQGAVHDLMKADGLLP